MLTAINNFLELNGQEPIEEQELVDFLCNNEVTPWLAKSTDGQWLSVQTQIFKNSNHEQSKS